jgi:hypothetical protein
MSTVVDLEALGAHGFAAVGGSGDLAGWSVSGAGDVNGDGYADVIIGAILNDDGGDSAGKAYVIFGGPTGFDSIDLDNLQPSDGFAIQGGSAFDFAGLSLSGAGDVNGDGFDDVIVGATPYGFYGYGTTSTAYVVFGSADPGDIDLSSLSSSDGFVMQGEYNYYSYGTVSVSGGGDFNGDGFDDLIVGAMYDNYTPGQLGYGFTNGAAYVIFGKASGFGTLDLTNLGSAGFEIEGALGDYAGRSVSWAGDINGDGFDDLIVGAPYGSKGGQYSGQAYVIFGKESGFAAIDLGDLASDEGFLIQGDQAGDYAGFSVSAAGDVNGDGLDDIIIGAPYGDNSATHAGEAYVIFGKESGFGTVDLTNLAASAGFIIQGDDTGDHAGWSVAAAGDVNGDGFADIIVGAPHNDNTRNGGVRMVDAGEAYVIFGKESGFGTIDLTNLSSADGFVIQGDSENDLAGFSVSGAGDIDGDGLDDLVIGAPQNAAGGAGAGAVYIISGQLQFGDAAYDFNGDGISDILWRATDGAIFNFLGTETGGVVNNGDNLYTVVANSWHVAGIADFNGDDRDDILWRNDNGAVFNFLSTPDGGVVNNGNNSWMGLSATWTVAGTGDFDGDHKDDILFRDANGVIFNYLGTESGGFTDNRDDLFTDVADAWHVAGVGDFDGDGKDDILWRNDDGTIFNFLGAQDGGVVNNGDNLYTLVANSWHVAGIGDFDGDGRDDILWRNDNGAVFNFLSTENGGVVNNGDNSYAAMSNAWQIEAIGDYNGDGREDVLWRHDDGTITNWLATDEGGFTANVANLMTNVGLEWQVQPNFTGVGDWDY